MPKPKKANFTIGFLHHAAGDHTLVLTKYKSSDTAVLLAGPFANRDEVLAEFEAVERALAAAKQKALELVSPQEQGVKTAQRAFAKVLEKADPKA